MAITSVADSPGPAMKAAAVAVLSAGLHQAHRPPDFGSKTSVLEHNKIHGDHFGERRPRTCDEDRGSAAVLSAGLDQAHYLHLRVGTSIEAGLQKQDSTKTGGVQRPRARARGTSPT